MKVAASMLVLLLLLAATTLAEDRPIVAVFDIEFRDVNLSAKTREKLNDYLCSLLAEKGYQVVPRAKLKESLQEKKKESYKQCYDQACQIEIGQELAAQKSLSTQMLKLGGECKVTVTIYDLKKSTSEGAAVASGGCDEAKIVKSLEKAVEQLVGGGTGQAPAPAPQPAPPVQQPPPMPQAAPPVEKAGLIWVKSVPAGIDFTKSEVTVAQYRACVEAGKCEEPTHFLGRPENDAKECNWRYPDRDNHPVNCVDWNQATAFCAWVGGRLPTEEEWDAEASNKGTRQCPWGDQAATCDYAVMDQGGPGCGRDSTWPVCSKEKGNSVSGLCDMSGNVWEWTSTSEGSDGVCRGGAWNMPPVRELTFKGWDDGSGGFRCGRSSR